MPTTEKQSPAAQRPRILLALGWYSSAIHQGIARYARQANWILDTSTSRDGRLSSSWRGDGIISLLHTGTELSDYVRSSTQPVVNIGDYDLPGVPTVRCDDAAIGRLAADHFLERGFRHGAFFQSSQAPSGCRRRDAFAERMRAAGGTFHLLDWPAQAEGKARGDERELIDWLGAELERLPRPLAVFSEHDEVAIEVQHACLNQGIPVPEQVAVLGVDDDPLRCDFAPVPLSSINNNQQAEGYQAAAMLDRLLNGARGEPSELLVPPSGVTTRLSTDILAVKNAHVAAALHHIWQNYTRPINAKTVAATVPMSYRRLHDAFRREIGRTIADEITLKRLEKAQNLLLETTQRAHDIADACGFTSEDRMGRIFKRVLNQTPLEFRRRNSLPQ